VRVVDACTVVDARDVLVIHPALDPRSELPG